MAEPYSQHGSVDLSGVTVPTNSDRSEVSEAFLITHCLQNDFVQPLEIYDGLPNQLHVGYDEALCLIGPDPEGGPIHTVMQWAYDGVPTNGLGIVHICDWHNSADAGQAGHQLQFGPHCLRENPGSRLCLSSANPERPHRPYRERLGVERFFRYQSCGDYSRIAEVRCGLELWECGPKRRSRFWHMIW